MIAFILAALLIVPAAHASRAPEFKIAKVFNAPLSEVKSLSSLKGKVVFLEFWATWCGPCVAGIPHTNRLIDALKGEPVVFIAVTDEPADMIAAYLKNHEMKAWVGVDEAKYSFKAYKNKSRPNGYLIGKDGTLLGRIFPDLLKESDVREAIAGKFKPRPESNLFGDADEDAPTGAKVEKALFELALSSASGSSQMSEGEGNLEISSVSFAQHIAWIWDVESDQVIAENPPIAIFNSRLKTNPEGFDRGRELLKLAVQLTFGITVTSEFRDADVYLLSLSTAPNAPRLQAGDPSMHSGMIAYGGSRLLGKTTLDEFARKFWMSVGKPVFDDTGLKGEYFLDLEWKASDADDRDRALSSVGLRLVPGRRKVEFLRVLPVKKN